VIAPDAAPSRIRGSAIYARVSTDRQETDNQLAQMRRFAESQQWEIRGEYVDHETGKHADREQFRRLFEDASRREFDVVLFWALDRFTREGPLETLQHLNILSNYGIAFRSFTEQYLDTCGIFKEAVVAILGTIAKQERIRISERVRAGLERARKNGTKTGRPIGRPRVVFRRDQVAELRTQGLSWPRIARKLGASVRTIRRAL
jgi:DNA invertase Pin-like site-specific DNA recombinase